MAQVLTEDRCGEECLHPESVRPILPRLMSESQADATAEWFATFADPTRTRILQALALTPELCVCDLALVLDMSVSALSHQLHPLGCSRHRIPPFVTRDSVTRDRQEGKT